MSSWTSDSRRRAQSCPRQRLPPMSRCRADVKPWPWRTALSLWAVALAGCATVAAPDLTRTARVIEAARDRTITCRSDDRCALASPVLAAARAPGNRLALLDDGADALAARVHLVRAARRSIDIQTFVFADDDAGRLIVAELVEAARRGVRVRVLSDQLNSLDNIRVLADVARVHANLSFKVYNPTFGEARTEPLEFVAGALCCFYRFNQRMHNKLWLVDGVAGITGGRNIENTYFGWGDTFNFTDRDVLALGEVGAEMQRSFEMFWSHEAAVDVGKLNDVAARILAEADGKAAPVAVEQLRYVDGQRVGLLTARAQDPEWIARTLVDTAHPVAEASYFSDSPAKHARGRKRDPEGMSRSISQRIGGLIAGAEREVLLQTPYLLISGKAEKIFEDLRKRNASVRVIASTNSLAATDSFVVYAVAYKHRRVYLRRLGFEIYEYKPTEGMRLESEDPFLPDLGIDWPGLDDVRARRDPVPMAAEGMRRTLHAKSLVIDEKIGLIGTHNFDPRSADLNTEAGLIVTDAAFARRLASSIRSAIEPQNSWTVARRAPAPGVSEFNETISGFSASLPLFDVWPFRYATSHELKPGCAPLSSQAPGFYDCYVAVGDFPAVKVPLRTLYTRFVVAFGVGLTPIL